MRFCGIDIGTTNTKGICLDEDLSLLARITVPAPHEPGTTSFPAQLWVDHFRRVVEHFRSGGVLEPGKTYCSITAQGGSFTVLDGRLDPISPALSWMALASQRTVDDLVARFGVDRYYKLTGWAPDRWLMACKVREWLGHPGNPTSQMRYITAVPEFLHAQLFQKPVTDLSSAGIDGLSDIVMGAWNKDVMEWAGVKEENLARIVKGLEVIAEGVDVLGDGSTRLNFVTSSHDQYAAMAGCGVDTGSVMLATGSAWVINGKTQSPLFDTASYLPHPGRDFEGRPFGYITTFGPIGKEFDALLQKLGIRYEDLDGRGEVREHMETVAARVRDVLAKLGVLGGLRKLTMTGGAVESPWWPRAVASVCGVPVEAVRFSELTAYGAALFARAAATGRMHRDGWPKGTDVVVYEPEKAR